LNIGKKKEGHFLPVVCRVIFAASLNSLSVTPAFDSESRETANFLCANLATVMEEMWKTLANIRTHDQD
jgi:hypothetical protein